MKTAGHFVSFIICLFFLASSFLSAALLLSHAGHCCESEDCAVCIHITNISNNLKFAEGGTNTQDLFICVFMVLAPLFVGKGKTFKDTPVFLKVQLNI